MELHEKSLTPTEWNLMECLWEHAPRTGREAAEYMAASQGVALHHADAPAADDSQGLHRVS